MACMIYDPQGPISHTDLSLASFQSGLYLSPKTDLSVSVPVTPALYCEGLQ